MKTLITILNLKYYLKKSRIGVLITMKILNFINNNHVQFAGNLQFVGIAILAIDIIVDKKNACKR